LFIAPTASGNNGKAYLIYGSSTSQNLALGSLSNAQGIAISGDSSNSEAGWAVNLKFDINKDGKIDPLVGCVGYSSSSGRIFFVSGSASMSNTNLNSLSGSNYGSGSATGEEMGYSIASGGDADGDGAVDMIVGCKPNFLIVYLLCLLLVFLLCSSFIFL
jgi:beta-xylosidase